MKAEEIMTKVANEHSYETWGELMYDTHEPSQIEYTKQAMEEYASIKLAEYKAELTEKVKCMDGIRFDIGKNKYETHLIKSEILKAIKP
jgi:hypothetical protein